LNSQTRRWVWSTQTRINREGIDMKMRRPMLLLASVGIGLLPLLAVAQALLESAGSSGHCCEHSAGTTRPDVYAPDKGRKALQLRVRRVRPVSLSWARRFAAGINQAHNTPPEWKQGAEGYGKRFGSNFGIAAVSTTTRYALAEAFEEDTMYYRCRVQRRLLPRLRHALISTLTARRGEDGHLFSFGLLYSRHMPAP
jgi:hypothetical protein